MGLFYWTYWVLTFINILFFNILGIASFIRSVNCLICSDVSLFLHWFLIKLKLIFLPNIVNYNWYLSIFDYPRRFSRLWGFKSKFRFFKSWRKVWFASSILLDFWRVNFITFLERIIELNLSRIINRLFFLFLSLFLL